MRKARLRNLGIGVAVAVAVFFGSEAIASAHDVTDVTVTCTKVTITYDNFPEGASPIEVTINDQTSDQAFQGPRGQLVLATPANAKSVAVSVAWAADTGGSWGPQSFTLDNCTTPTKSPCTSSSPATTTPQETTTPATTTPVTESTTPILTSHTTATPTKAVVVVATSASSPPSYSETWNSTPPLAGNAGLHTARTGSGSLVEKIAVGIMVAALIGGAGLVTYRRLAAVKRAH